MAKSKLSLGFYKWNRRLHLYFGVFICPFLVIFAVSTVMLNHRIRFTPSETVETTSVEIPDELIANVRDKELLAKMSNPEKIAARKALGAHLLAELELEGEWGAGGFVQPNGTTRVGATVPGMMTNYVINVETKQAEKTVKRHNLFETMRYLHMNPGPHRHPVWIGTKMWGWIADSTVYLTIFLSLSGIYLWYMVKAERKTGLLFMGAGCVSFVAILYALVFA